MSYQDLAKAAMLLAFILAGNYFARREFRDSQQDWSREDD